MRFEGEDERRKFNEERRKFDEDRMTFEEDRKKAEEDRSEFEELKLNAAKEISERESFLLSRSILDASRS